MIIATKNIYNKIMSYLRDKAFITDIVCRLTITFGIVLIVGSLYMMIANPSGSTQATQSVASTINWIPGIPFLISDLINSGVGVMGLISWIIGIDLLLVGLGLWIRHRLARLTAMIIFILAAYFQLIQFSYLGYFGSPAAVFEVIIDGLLVYLLLSKFDSKSTAQKKALV